MDLRKFRNFLAVVEHGGFTRAAKALFMSQPALSESIRELEAELGTELFYRLGRTVTLSPAGKALVEPARQVIRDFEQSRLAVQSVTGLESGRLDLCSLPSLAADPLAPIIGAFRSKHPGLMVVAVSPRSPAELIRLLKDGACEVGVADARDVPEGLVSKPLVTQELFAVLPSGLPCDEDPLPLEQLQNLPIVATPTGTFIRNLLDEALAGIGLKARYAVVMEQRDAVAPLVASGAGAAILPRPQAESLAARGAAVRSVEPKLIREVVITHRPTQLSPAAEVFAAVGLELFRDAAQPDR